MFEEIKEMFGVNQTTVAEHYGVKESEFQEIIKEILIDLIKEDNKTFTIDKHFGDLDGEQRVKVFAFSRAMEMRMKIE